MPDPAFDRYRVTLRLTQPARFHLCHGGVVQGLIRRSLQTHQLAGGLIPFACESGRVRFAPGDRYCFGVTMIGEARSLARGLRDGLCSRGVARREAGFPPATLEGNFEVVSMDQLDAPDLAGEAARLAGAPAVGLQFLSPLRLERPRELQVKGAAFMNGDCFPAGQFLSRLFNRIFFLEQGRYPDRTERDQGMPPLPPAVVTRETELLWLDLPVEGVPGSDPHRPHGYTLGGVVGRAVLEGIPGEWARFLVLGRHLHVGENCHFGLGRYAVFPCTAPGSPARSSRVGGPAAARDAIAGAEAGQAGAIDDEFSIADEPFLPAHTYHRQIADVEPLNRALDHLVSRSEAAGIDGIRPEEFADERDRRIPELARSVGAAEYKAQPLLGFIDRKKSGGVRALAIPTVADRVVQRAASEAMGLALDTLLEDCSYAYRKGFSRAGAARAIVRAYEDGFRHVLDADIESFFDAVSWSRLFGKVRALFPFEPLVHLIEDWVRQPVVFQGREVRRHRGLPQGGPISPLLANLYLDEFDEDLLGKEYRLVRYGDDFVVLCKDLESAQEAREEAKRALQKLDLRLNEEKTEIVSMDDGFTYLGYLFCRSVVLDREAAAEAEAPPADLKPDGISPSSWLAQVPFERVRALIARKGNEREHARVEAVPMVSPTIPLHTRRPLYLNHPAVAIHLRGDALEIEVPEKEPRRIPLESVLHVVVVGAVRLTVPAVLALNRAGVPVFFCRRSGELYASCDPHAPDWSCWMAQAAAVANEGFRVSFAREVIMAKLHNFATMMIRLKLRDADSAVAQIRQGERECANKSNLDNLRGLEGQGAAAYFRTMRDSLADEWGFTGRKSHPSPDPVNAMLSLGYTILYNHLATALMAAGLNPRIGILHAEHGAYAALACDLQEEFRHLVDGVVWAKIHHNEVQRSHFAFSPGGPFPCLMTRESRGSFIDAVEQRFATTFTPEGQTPMTYREFMDVQARQVRDLIRAAQTTYRPLRVHS